MHYEYALGKLGARPNTPSPSRETQETADTICLAAIEALKKAVWDGPQKDHWVVKQGAGDDRLLHGLVINQLKEVPQGLAISEFHISAHSEGSNVVFKMYPWPSRDQSSRRCWLTNHLLDLERNLRVVRFCGLAELALNQGARSYQVPINEGAAAADAMCSRAQAVIAKNNLPLVVEAKPIVQWSGPAHSASESQSWMLLSTPSPTAQTEPSLSANGSLDDLRTPSA